MNLVPQFTCLPCMQASSSEPQPAERAESPPTPVAPPASFFHSRDPLPSMQTSHITVPSVTPPLPPSPARVLTVGPAPGQQMYSGVAAARGSRAPAFPAHLRPAVASLQVCLACRHTLSANHNGFVLTICIQSDILSYAAAHRMATLPCLS